MDKLKFVYTSDVKPVVHAHWVEEPERNRHWHCSACGKVQGVTSVAMNYCPNCGAKMAEHPWLADGVVKKFSP